MCHFFCFFHNLSLDICLIVIEFGNKFFSPLQIVFPHHLMCFSPITKDWSDIHRILLDWLMYYCILLLHHGKHPVKNTTVLGGHCPPGPPGPGEHLRLEIFLQVKTFLFINKAQLKQMPYSEQWILLSSSSSWSVSTSQPFVSPVTTVLLKGLPESATLPQDSHLCDADHQENINDHDDVLIWIVIACCVDVVETCHPIKYSKYSSTVYEGDVLILFAVWTETDRVGRQKKTHFEHLFPMTTPKGYISSNQMMLPSCTAQVWF